MTSVTGVFYLVKTDPKSTTIMLWNANVAVIDRNDVGLVAIQAHLVATRPE